MKEAILEYLAKGVAAVDVGKIVGCSASYISQLCADEEFKATVLERRVQYLATVKPDDRLEDRYEQMEHKLLDAMTTAMGTAELPAITMALATLHKRQAYKSGHIIPGALTPAGVTNIQNNTTIVSLTLPAHALEAQKSHLTLNSQSEVIAIDNKPLAPMPATAVKDLFNGIADRRAAVIAAKQASDKAGALLQMEI